MTKRTQNRSLQHTIYKDSARGQALIALSSHPAVIASGLNTTQIRVEPITQKALDESYLWGGQATLYPWEDVPAWKSRDRKGFDLAIWFGIELCGLCYATPRKSTICIKVILLEGKPDETHPLKGLVAPLAIAAIDSYARMLGITEIEIEDPEHGAVDWYRKLGFEYDGAGRLVIAVNDL